MATLPTHNSGMMRLWLRLTGGLIGVLVIAILGARLIAPHTALPFPLDTINQSANCQLPCWHGFTPGSTTLDQVEASLDNDLLYDRVSDQNEYGSYHWRLSRTPTDPNDVVITFDAEQRVSRIDLSGQMTIGQMVSTLGRPIAQDQSCYTQVTLLFRSVLVVITRGSPSPTALNGISPTELVGIDISATTLRPSEVSNAFQASDWHGFTSSANSDVNATCID